MSDFSAQFQKIETWDSKSIKQVLNATANDPALKATLQQRYQPLIDLIEGKDLSALSSIPNKLTTTKATQKQWTPDAASIEVLGSIPMEEIMLKKAKVFPEWITHLKLLQTLRILESKNLVFPETMHHMAGLTTLICYDCQFKEIPEQLRGLKEIQELDFGKNQVTSVPDWIAEFPLKVLNLSFNKISQLNKSIVGLYKLNTLEIEYNQLQSLPEEIGDLARLTSLKLGGNKALTVLPYSISKLNGLRILDLSANNFKVVPEQIEQLKKLRTLDFSLNPISEIPGWIGELKLLEELRIQNTDVEMLPGSMLQLGALYSLDINKTPLQLKNSFSSSIDKVLIKNYLTRLLAKKEDPLAAVYSDLESRDAAKIKNALKTLESDRVLWKRAEKRYLGFIQARLNDTNATLWQFADAMLSEEEEETLMKTGVEKKTFITFHYFDGKESKLLIDFAGALVKNVIDMDLFCKEAAGKSSQGELMTFGEYKLTDAKRAIMEEAAVYINGWFGRLMAAFAGINIHKVMYDHTTLDEANKSLVLREFMFFAAAFGATHSVDFDIFQSEAPDFTEVFWLLPFIPKTIWGDTEPVFPKSPLAFKRTVEMKVGDFSDWEKWIG